MWIRGGKFVVYGLWMRENKNDGNKKNVGGEAPVYLCTRLITGVSTGKVDSAQKHPLYFSNKKAQ